MKDQDFTCSITANVTAKQATEGICNVSEWWAKNFEGNSKNPGDVFSVRFGETFVTFKITEFVPGKKIVWTVTDCYLHWLQNKTEWTSTKIIFDIAEANNTTTINFTHQGLQPQVECYNDCVQGWTGHLTGSLLNLLTTGKGQPE